MKNNTGEARRKELLELLSEKEQRDSKKLSKEIKKGKKVKGLEFKSKSVKRGSVCLTIPQEIQSSDMVAYCWDNSDKTGGNYDEYVNFKIYENKFQSISANRDINKGFWSEEYNGFISHNEEQFLSELKVMYYTLIELNMKRFKNDTKSGNRKVDLFFRSMLIHLQNHSRYSFNRLFVLSKLKVWRFNYAKNPNQSLLKLQDVLGNRGKVVKERDFKLKEDAVIKEVEGEYNSFLSRLSEDKKRYSIKNLFDSGLISDLVDGYLRPIMTDDLNLCKYSHREIKKLVNKYNEELTGGTDNRHLSNYVDVADFVSECFEVYVRCEKMCKVTPTVYIDTYIECDKVYTQFTESKYFPKVSDVVRELNINNRRSITKSLQALKRPIEKVVENAEAVLMLMDSNSYEIKNINIDGKNRLSIVPTKAVDIKEVVREMRADYIGVDLDSDLLNKPFLSSREDEFMDVRDMKRYCKDEKKRVSDLEGFLDSLSYDMACDRGSFIKDLWMNHKGLDINKVMYDVVSHWDVDKNLFDIEGWKGSEYRPRRANEVFDDNSGSESMPRQFEKEYSDDLLDLVRDIEQSCSSVIELDSKQVKLYM